LIDRKISAPSSTVAAPPLSAELKEFARKVSHYFLDFLETDFKRQQAPRRKIQLTNDTGFRTGVPLRKYPQLFADLWALAAEPASGGLKFTLPRGRYVARISATLRDLIRQHIGQLPISDFEEVRIACVEVARQRRDRGSTNPERYVEEVQGAFADRISHGIIGPILAFLDRPFRQQAYSAVESVYEVETDLSEALASPVLPHLATALNTFLVTGDLAPTERVLKDFFSDTDVKARLVSFFDDFATADAHQEVRDLINYLRTADNLQIYLYLCDLRHGKGAGYPLFYVPARIMQDNVTGSYLFEFDPHLYVNKRVVDYICQEIHDKTGRFVVSPVRDRICYLGENQTFLQVIERVLTPIRTALDLPGPLDLRAPGLQTLGGAALRFTTAAYLAAFDKSDESLLNDYEELLLALNTNKEEVTCLFERIIQGLLLDNPIPVEREVRARWERLPVPDRLVAESPIPLNEEQRRILDALRDERCRYLAVQGPPGTGKSHTITAIAFDCILHRQNVLVLSDKQEALDVVEEKLRDALAAVRYGEDFPDAILRLGRVGGNYTRLLSQTAQARIQDYHRAAHARLDALLAETRERSDRLKRQLAETILTYARVKLPQVARLHALEAGLERRAPGLCTHLQNPRMPGLLNELADALRALPTAGAWQRYLAEHVTAGGGSGLHRTVRVHAVAHALHDHRRHREALALFSSLGPGHQKTLQGFLVEYDQARMPVFGYLFRGARVRAINARLASALPCENPLNLHKRLGDLRTVHEVLVAIRRALPEAIVPDEDGSQIYDLLGRERAVPAEIAAVRGFLDLYDQVLGPLAEGVHAGLRIDPTQFRDPGELLAFLADAARYACLWSELRAALQAVPQFDYVGEKTQLEQLYTSQMATEIDGRFLDFVQNERGTARALAGVIRAKQRFPQDAFASFKNAFPCIIASIREFAEYVPLQRELFEIVVIDEASQVSVAQAFPALLRASKVIVFGDHRQFSNVKAANASILRNQTYLTDIEAYFRNHISDAADRIQRLKQFDVKKSILDFFKLIANYEDMLRKHFRGYQELISFSSEHFYEGQLQAIKVRGKPIEEVLQFTQVTPSPTPEQYRNVNSAEATFIRDHLRELVDDELGMTVGVITPHREQQQYLTRLLFDDAYADRFQEQLKLKVMTFDTCQGEERDLIIYSMVATPTHDVLNYVFPVSLEAAERHVEEALKAQRLNVGFSRAKEAMHFVISKPVEEFHGSIGRALAHYSTLLESKAIAEPVDTDPRSPMEAKVLEWIKKTGFFQRHRQRLELIAQFPVGDYLRQLDPTYTHPRYRSDFLLRYRQPQRTVNIIIEYDGFEEHFIPGRGLSPETYPHYYRPEDIERQMVLESYGYKFLRINRFNLGLDPVVTLDERLTELIKAATTDDEPSVVSTIRTDAESLDNGTAKHCRKCGQVKPKEAFFDPELSTRYGQVCMVCKRSARRGRQNWRWRR